MTLLELMRLLKHKLAWVIAVPIVCAVLCAGITAFVLPAKYSATAVINATAEAGSVGSIAESAAKEAASQSGVTAKEKTDTNSKTITITMTGKNTSSIMSALNASVDATNEKVASIYGEKVVLNSTIASNVTDESPNPLKYGAVALIAGLFVVVCIVVLIDMVKAPIHSKEEVEETYEIPFLGSCAASKGLTRANAKQINANQADNISYSKPKHGTHSVSETQRSVSSTPAQKRSLDIQSANNAGGASNTSFSGNAVLVRESLLANLRFASDAAKSYCIVPVSPSDNAYLITSELARAAQEENLAAEFREVYAQAHSQEAFIANANKYGRTAFLSCCSAEEGVGSSYAANTSEATVLVLNEMNTTHKQLQETIRQLTIAKANVIGFVTAPWPGQK